MNAIVNGSILSLQFTAAVWLALRLLPRRSVGAAARYGIWWIALVAAISLPIAYLPARVSPESASIATRTADVQAAVFEQIQTTLSIPHVTATRPLFPLRVPVGNWTRWIGLAWALSAMLMLARLILSCFTLLRRKRAAQPIDLAAPLPRRARVLLSAGIPAPMAVGFLHPAILLPARFLDQLTPDQIQQIVLHESAHLARHDDYALLFQRAIEAAFALHPAVWFIARQIDLEREIACDARVVRTVRHPTSYAACLIRVAEMSQPISFAAAAFSYNRSQLSRRVDELLDRARTAPVRFLGIRLALVVLTLTALAWALNKTPALLAFSSPLPSPAPQLKPQPAPTLLAQAAPPQAPAGARPQAPAPAQLVSLVMEPVQVTTPDGYSVQDLTRDDFTVLEDGVRQTVTYFALDDSPRALEVVVFDSSSLKQQTLDALATLEKTPGAHVTYRNASDPPARQSAAEQASQRLQQLPNRHKTLLLLGPRQEDLPRPVVQNNTQFALTSEAGLRPSPEEVFRSYLATSYLLGYPARQTGGKYVNVKVVVDRPNLLVYSRRGYYAER